MNKEFMQSTFFLLTPACWRYIAWSTAFFFVSSSIPAQVPDSTSKNIDSTLTLTGDTLTIDSLQLGEDFKSEIKYHAEDSTVYDLENDKVYLFGKGTIDYEDLHLAADYIEINFDNRTIFAKGLPDSSGNIAGKPVFKQGADEFKSESMIYNFDTKKGKIKGITTQEGESFIRGEEVKKQPDNSTFIKNGYYTTCNDEHPHYYIYSNKIKVIPDNKVLTGPANLVIADVPTPFAVPFGFFPNKKGRTSGILFPAYGESSQLGFYLQNGGYYLGLSDHFDMALTGDVYSLGSWRVNGQSNYAWRYRFSGNMSVNYSKTISGEKELSDFVKQKDFFIRWSHSQDPRARPNSLFSANVNAGSTTFYRNNISSANNYLTNTFQSSVSYSKTWAGKPYSFSSSATHSQNSNTGAINLGLPSASFNVSRISPFKRKIAQGGVRWYEKVGISYSASMVNSISTYDSLFLKPGWEKDFRNGMQHSIPLSTSFLLFKYFNLSPGINYTERWYLNTIRKHYNFEKQELVTEKKKEFVSVRDLSFGASFNTRVYGLVQFKKGKFAAIRHVLTPTLSYAYKPDLTGSSENYLRYYTSSTGSAVAYNIYEGAVYGGPATGKSSTMSFSLDNNLEMKVRQLTDSTDNLKKIKLFESIAISGGYNFLADSLNLSQLALSARTTLFDRVNVTYSAGFDPYITDANNVRQNKFEWNENKRLARFTNGSLAIGFNLINKKKEYKKENASTDELKQINNNPDAYLDFNVPFNLNVSYAAYIKAKELVAEEEDRVTQTLNFNGDLSVTPNWKITFGSGYDVTQKQWTYTNLGFYRDLHCWEMRFNWVPFGYQENYNFQINVKSSILQDLKLTKKKDIYDR